MKRFLCILISFSFVLAACAATAENENAKISFTITDEGDAICLKTSLLPEQKATIFQADNVDPRDIFMLIQPEFLPRLLYCFQGTILDLNKERACAQEGSYAGDLFEHASIKEEIELTGEEMINLISKAVNCCLNTQNETSDTSLQPETLENPELILRSITGKAFDLNTRVRINTYDKKYISINIVHGDEIFVALSTEISGEYFFHILLARGIADTVFYEEMTCAVSPKEIEYSSSLFRVKAPSFRMVSEQDCVQFAEIRYTDLSEDNYAFEGEIQSILFDSTMHIKGNWMHGENGRGMISTELEAAGQGAELTKKLIPMLYSILQFKP